MKLMSPPSAARPRKKVRTQHFHPTLERLEDRNLFAGDLHGAFLDVPADADWGDTIQVQGRIDQWGWDASGRFDVQWYLSDDTLASDDDLLLPHANDLGSSFRHPSIGGDTGFFARGPRLNVELQLPDALPVGWTGNTFHLLMQTDAGNEVNEWYEGNNLGERGAGIDQAIITVNTPTSYLYFSDASHDGTPSHVFQEGAIRFHYNLKSWGSDFNPVQSTVYVEAIQDGNVVAEFGPYRGAALSNQLINLSGSNLDAGNITFRPRGKLLSGQAVYGKPGWLTIQTGSSLHGDTSGETFHLADLAGEGVVVNGAGGTDTLVINVTSSTVTALNGHTLEQFAPENGVTAQQAIYQGSAYDFLQLDNGREVYLAGIERLEFADDVVVELLVRANDPAFNDQWNLHTQDVPGAWRFTQGSQDVLLVSLDTGLLTPDGRKENPHEDMTASRLITDPTDDDNHPSYGHGHQAISVMSATANNSEGIAGINWVSDVYVADVYIGVQMIDAISDALEYASNQGQRVVFQGGIQGNFWLTGGGQWRQEELTDLISRNATTSLFAVAAGNFNTNLNERGGVAALQTTHDNVMAVGAEKHIRQDVHGLENARNLFRAGYSNFGADLTMMAATDSPAVNKQGQINTFTGTSAANPNMAAIASLVWSALPTATGAEIRQILIDTATDLSLPGPDDQTGAGMVNAEAAVRRAIALARDASLAQLYRPLVLPGLEAVAGRVQAKQNLPFMQAPELEVEVISQVARGIHDQLTQSIPSRQTSGTVKSYKQSVDSVFVQETSWTEAVAVAKAESDHVQHTSQHATKKSEIDDFWQGHGLVEPLV
jgi:serine protease